MDASLDSALLGNSLQSRDIATLLHPYTNLARHREIGPLVIERGEGIYVFDDSGKRYIEGLSGMWCTALGYGEERLVQAAAEEMRRLAYYHTFASKSHGPAIELAAKLVEIAPEAMSKVFFTSSGSEANDTQVKLVWYYNNAIGRPKKKKIIARQRGYHGVTIVSASLTGIELNHRDFDLPIDRILHVSCPSHYREGLPGESEEDFATRLAEELELTILREGPETVAAFIAEPIIGGGGVFTPPATYFEKIQDVLDRYDILFIADEVICGFGRTGNWFGCQTVNAHPDTMTIAKNLSAGYLPIAGLMISAPMYDALVEQSRKIGGFSHGFTYGGHPVCCAVALEALKIYEERNIVGHVQTVGPYFQERLRAFNDHPLVGEVRGTGLIAGIELVKDKAARTYFDHSAGVGPFFAQRAQERGLILRCVAGTDIIALAPPLVTTGSEIDEILDILQRTLADTEAMVARVP